MFEKEIVIDGKGHLLGRLASIVAKELLSGQRIVVVRAEQINVSGSLFRNRIKFMEYLNKRMIHNPRRGTHHFRTPSRVFWRSVRGMTPHKTPKGAAALGKLKVFDGIPAPYDHKKRKVVPKALKALRLQNFRKFCVLGELMTTVGWKKKDLLEKLEAKRKLKSRKFYEKKLGDAKLRTTARNAADNKGIREKLAKLGY